MGEALKWSQIGLNSQLLDPKVEESLMQLQFQAVVAT
jgi:hypothetical protein